MGKWNFSLSAPAEYVKMFEEGDTAHGITFLLAFKIMTYMYLYHYRFRARHRVGTEDNSEIFFLSFHQ